MFISFFCLGCNSLNSNAQSCDTDAAYPVCDLIKNESHFLNVLMYNDIRQMKLSRPVFHRIFTSVTHLIAGKQVRRTRAIAMFFSAGKK